MNCRGVVRIALVLSLCYVGLAGCVGDNGDKGEMGYKGVAWRVEFMLPLCCVGV